MPTDPPRPELIGPASLQFGPPPTEPVALNDWLRKVHRLAGELETLMTTREFAATIVNVEEVSGRGVITTDHMFSGKGKPTPETIRTQFLSSRAGRAVFDQAVRLKGRKVMIGKYHERRAGSTDPDDVISMVRWIRELSGSQEPAEPASSRNGNGQRQAPQPPASQPAPRQAPPPPPPPPPSARPSSPLPQTAPRTASDLMEMASVHFGFEERDVVLVARRASTEEHPISDEPFDWRLRHVARIWDYMVRNREALVRS